MTNELEIDFGSLHLWACNGNPHGICDSLEHERYLESHPKETGMMNSIPLQNSPRLMMALVGLVVGVVSGAIIGLLAYGASKFIAPRVPMPQH